MLCIPDSVQHTGNNFRTSLIEETETRVLPPRSGYFPYRHRPYQHHLQRLGLLARSEPRSVESVPLISSVVGLPSFFLLNGNQKVSKQFGHLAFARYVRNSFVDIYLFFAEIENIYPAWRRVRIHLPWSSES
jgi:hypothetical protein